MKQEDLEKILGQLYIVSPSFSVIVRYSRIAVVDRSPGPVDSPAFTDGRTIYLTPSFDKFTLVDKTFIIAHEVLHNFLLHVQRSVDWLKRHDLFCDERWHLLANIVADYIVNETLRTLPLFRSVRIGVNSATVSNECLNISMTLEEMLECFYEKMNLAMKTVSTVGAGNISDLKPSAGSEISDARTIYEGDKVDQQRSYGDYTSEISRRSAQIAGLGAGSLEVSVDLKPSTKWSLILRRRLSEGYMRSRRSYGVLNRKHLDDGSVIKPGRVYYGQGRLVVLIDVSGSIGERDLKVFGEVIASVSGRFSEVVVVLWDDGIQSIQKFRGRLPDKIKATGGGGTRFKPVFEHITSKLRLRRSDAVVLLSDFYWSESEKERDRMISELRKRADLVLVSVGEKIDGAIMVKK